MAQRLALSFLIMTSNSQLEPNRDVYNYVLLAFEAWQNDGHRKNEYYQRLCELADKLELPADSPAHKILATAKAPTTDQAKLVATVLGKRAIDRLGVYMSAITSKEQAVERALNYIEEKGYKDCKCKGATKVPQEFKGLWADLIEGDYNKEADLWSVAFISIMPESVAVCTANGFAVFVESENGNCGAFFGM